MKWIIGYLAVGALVSVWFCLTVTEEDLGEEKTFLPLLGGTMFYIAFWPLQLAFFVRAMIRGEL